jgi:hypothetical protein
VHQAYNPNISVVQQLPHLHTVEDPAAHEKPSQSGHDSQAGSTGALEVEEFELGEDVYSLIFVSPVCSISFFFSLYIALLKLTLFTFLALDLYTRSDGAFDNKNALVRGTQFFLIPVAIAMQQDLIHVYTRIANIRYDPSILEISPSATEWKFAFSFLLRFCDGLYSLIINFVVLLITDEVLSIFLNFAALGFLQTIDDVAFNLASQGTFVLHSIQLAMQRVNSF